MDRDKLRKMLLDNVKISKLQSSTKQNMPSPMQMAKNLATTAVNAAKSVAAGNPLNVTPEEANKRKAICEQCDFYNKIQQRCTKCGCYMAVKAYLRVASCPVGKW